ncbi:MAG TPA: hypothetical protein VK324_16175 [Tepidisphaeraceae bacterium]|nr:hypothetical protein [Tepidisphaeraceae bacterium]
MLTHNIMLPPAEGRDVTHGDGSVSRSKYRKRVVVMLACAGALVLLYVCIAMSAAEVGRHREKDAAWKRQASLILLRRIKTSALAYHARTGQRPPTDNKGLRAALETVAPFRDDAISPSEELIDGWGKPVRLARHDEADSIYSYGPDGADDMGDSRKDMTVEITYRTAEEMKLKK